MNNQTTKATEAQHIIADIPTRKAQGLPYHQAIAVMKDCLHLIKSNVESKPLTAHMFFAPFAFPIDSREEYADDFMWACTDWDEGGRAYVSEAFGCGRGLLDGNKISITEHLRYGTLVHIAITQDKGVIKFYINGKLEITLKRSGNLSFSGIVTQLEEDLKMGMFEAYKLEKRAYSASEIKQVYNDGKEEAKRLNLATQMARQKAGWMQNLTTGDYKRTTEQAEIGWVNHLFLRDLYCQRDDTPQIKIFDIMAKRYNMSYMLAGAVFDAFYYNSRSMPAFLYMSPTYEKFKRSYKLLEFREFMKTRTQNSPYAAEWFKSAVTITSSESSQVTKLFNVEV